LLGNESGSRLGAAFACAASEPLVAVPVPVIQVKKYPTKQAEYKTKFRIKTVFLRVMISPNRSTDHIS